MSRSGRIDGERLLGDLKELAAFGALPGGGIDRPAFSQPCTAAAEWLLRKMRDAGLAVRMDAAGNIIGRLGPEDRPALLCGSHIDTVPSGGAFDGALGVIAALECARVLAESGTQLETPLEVVAFADEEGAYLSVLGSRAMTGALDPDEVFAARGRDGEPLGDAMSRAGLDIAAVLVARPQQVAGYLELHIEQGPVLEMNGIDVGIVDSIVGIDTTEYVLHGEARHSGTTPMAGRRDAGRAAAEAITEAFAKYVSVDGARVTFGAITFTPGASNVVPGTARVTSEVRAAELGGVEALRNSVDDVFGRVAAKHGVSLEKRLLGRDLPGQMAPEMIELLQDVCADLDRTFTIMPSGASHDAVSFAPIAPTGMIFIPSRGGISHHPDEFSEPSWVIAGAEVLLEAIRRIASR